MRTIRLTGFIDEAMVERFSEQLDKLCDASTKPISIEICSGGGDALCALAIVGMMDGCGMKIATYGYGKVMSAATLILAAGDERSIEQECWLMTHEDSVELEGMSVNDCYKEILQHLAQEQQWNRLLARYTGTPAHLWDEMNQKTTYLTAAEAVKLGLADKVMEGRNSETKKKIK